MQIRQMSSAEDDDERLFESFSWFLFASLCLSVFRMFLTLENGSETFKSLVFLVILLVFHREILPDLVNNFYIYPGPITRRVKGVRYIRAPACQGVLSR